MSKFNVWIQLVETYEAETADDAFDMALDAIANRDGMDISSHEIIEENE